MTAAPTLESPRTRHSAVAVAALFFVNGATFSNWLPRIPEIRDNLGLGNAGLGVTLLGGGLGGIIGALVVGQGDGPTGQPSRVDHRGNQPVDRHAADCLRTDRRRAARAAHQSGHPRRVQRRGDECPGCDRPATAGTVDHEPAARDVELGVHGRCPDRIGRVGGRRRRARPTSRRRSDHVRHRHGRTAVADSGRPAAQRSRAGRGWKYRATQAVHRRSPS